MADDRSPRWDWERAVLASNLSSTQKLVALVIATHMDKAGRARLSLAKIATKSGLDRRTVARALPSIEQTWLEVTRERVPGKRRHSANSYLAVIPTSVPGRGTVPPLVGAEDPQGRGTVPPLVGAERPQGRGTAPLGVGAQCPPYRSVSTDQVTDQTTETPCSFEEVWAVSRRGSKKKALAEYRKAVPKKTSHEALLAGWRAHVESASEERYISHLFRWVRDERWDERPAARGKGRATLVDVDEDDLRGWESMR